MSPYLRLIRFDKPTGTLLLLWPTLLGFAACSRYVLPSLSTFLIFLSGVFISRSLGCAINDIVDMEIDSKVERTKSRPLPSGDLTLQQALLFTSFLSIIACLLAFTLTKKALIFIPITAALIVIYPFCKRITYLPQFVLGTAFAMPLVLVSSQLNIALNPALVFVFVGVMLWVVAYDTQYALSDIKDDMKIGVKSTALLLCKKNHHSVFVIQTLSLVAFAIYGYLEKFSEYYFLSLVFVFFTFMYQHFLLLKNRLYLSAFKNNNYVGMLLTLGVVCG